MKRNLLLTLFSLFLLLVSLSSSANFHILSDQECVGSDGIILPANWPSYYNYTFSWQLSIDGGTTWTTVSDDTTYSTTNEFELHIHNVLASMDHYRYRAIILNTNDTSDIATLLVDTVPPNTPVFVNPITTVCQGASYQYNLTGGFTGDTVYIFGCCYNVYSYPGGSGYEDSSAQVLFNSVGTMSLTAYTHNGCGSASSTPISITVNPAQTSPAGVAGAGMTCTTTYTIPFPTPVSTDASCNPINIIKPSGASPVSGSIQTCVTVDASVQSYNGAPYVQRHYNIEPAVNAATATATLTLYYTQADFDAYNLARGSNPALPTGPSDATGISNLRVTQFHGTGTTPGTYTGTTGEIDPDDNNIVWNATASRWEVTFDVTGFSGFFTSTASLIPLPLTLTDFSGKTIKDGNLLQWTTSSEENTAYFEVDRGVAGSAFTYLTKLAAAGNSHLPLHYQYTDNDAADGATSYRLKMVDLDGKSTYSKTIVLQHSDSSGYSIQVSPNPFHESETIRIVAPTAGNALLMLTDISGRVVDRQSLQLAKGINPLPTSTISGMGAGTYLLTLWTDGQQRTVKLVRY